MLREITTIECDNCKALHGDNQDEINKIGWIEFDAMIDMTIITNHNGKPKKVNVGISQTNGNDDDESGPVHFCSEECFIAYLKKEKVLSNTTKIPVKKSAKKTDKKDGGSFIV